LRGKVFTQRERLVACGLELGRHVVPLIHRFDAATREVDTRLGERVLVVVDDRRPHDVRVDGVVMAVGRGVLVDGGLRVQPVEPDVLPDVVDRLQNAVVHEGRVHAGVDLDECDVGCVVRGEDEGRVLAPVLVGDAVDLTGDAGVKLGELRDRRLHVAHVVAREREDRELA